MKTWKDKLNASQATFMQEIVDQVPEAMGVRKVFTDILDNLAGVSSTRNGDFRFFVVDMIDDEVTGTNDEKKARELANEAETVVIDGHTSMKLIEDGMEDDIQETP